MKKPGYLGLCACLLAAAAACQRPAPQGAGQGRLFGVSFQTMNNPFFVDLNAGLLEVIEARGDRLVTLDGQFNSLKQKNDLSDLILQGASGIFVNPINWEGIRGSLLQAKQARVACIVVDTPAKDADLVACTVASDNVEAGRLAARALAKVRPDAKVVILHHFSGKACIDRVAGFQEELKQHPDIKVLDIQEGKGSTEGARPVMRDLLGRFPELTGVFPINDPSALGAISALDSAGRKDVIVVTVDGSPEAVAAIKAGKLHSTSAQFPREIGRRAAEKMYDLLAGKPVEKDVQIRVELITAENADAYLKNR